MSNTSINNYSSGEALRVFRVGEDFKNSAEANADIDRLLGFVSEVHDGEAYRQDTDNVLWKKAPDYCGDDALTVELMNECGVVPFIMVADHYLTEKRREKKKLTVNEYAVLFDMKGILHLTLSFETESRAAACALWYVLSNK